MAEKIPYAGALVGFERDQYEARADPATGEILPAKTVMRVWLSAPEGDGAPSRITVNPEQFADCERAGFGADVKMLVRLGAYRDAITRSALDVEFPQSGDEDV